jgi:hypothetical protein
MKDITITEHDTFEGYHMLEPPTPEEIAEAWDRLDEWQSPFEPLTLAELSVLLDDPPEYLNDIKDEDITYP